MSKKSKFAKQDLSRFKREVSPHAGKRRSPQKRSSSKASEHGFERLEARQLLAGITFSDSFATDTVGSVPEIQATDVGVSWEDLGTDSPVVGTGSATSGLSAPLGSDIQAPSQWVGFNAPSQTLNGVFTEMVTTNGSTIEFDLNPSAISSTLLTTAGVFVKGEVGNLIELEFAANDSLVPFETSVPFEVIVNGLATGASGPAANAWSNVEITLNESSWDLEWQLYDVQAGETAGLIGPVHSIVGLEYRAGAGGSARGVTFSSDGGQDNVGLGGISDGDGVMFISNVEVVDANDIPEALNDFYTLDINTSVAIDVLTNDVDEDTLTLTGYTDPANGTLIPTGNGMFTYTPDFDFFGADQFDYTIEDESGVSSTATAYVYTTEVLGLPAYASNPNAPAVLYLDLDGDSGDLPFDRDGDISFFTEFEQDLIRQSVEYTAMMFSMYDVNVTTVLTPDLPKAWIRLRSNGSGGAAYLGSFPNTTSRGWVSSSDRNLTTGLAHEYGHILSVTHQRVYDVDGVKTNEYRWDTDGEGAVMGVDFAGNVVKWWWEHDSPTNLQDDLAEMATEISGASAAVTGFAADDHESSFALATPAELNGGVWSAGGVINSLDDVDTFVFDWDGGDVDVNAFRVDPFTNSNRGDPSSVDIVLSVYDLEGNLLGYANPDSYLNNSGLDADVTIPDLAAGTYAVSISSHGDYADIGQYFLEIESGDWMGTNPTDINSLDAPADLDAVWANGTSIAIQWSQVAGASGYSIERSINKVDFVEVATVPASEASYSDEGGKDYSTTYFYRVRAVDGDGVSVASNVTQMATRSAAVTDLRVSNFIGTSKVLDWKAQRTSGETGFRIERATDGVNFSTIATLPANTPSYTDTGLDVGLNYTYRVVTVDELGDAASANEDRAVQRLSFNDSTGHDSSGYGKDNSGTLHNGATVTYDSGRASRVLTLDGTDDYVSVPDSSDINLGTHGTRTISVSFNASTISGRQVIYEEGGATAGYSIYLDGAQLYMGAWGMNDGAANAYFTSGPTIVPGQWYSASLVNDFDSAFISGYLDGMTIGGAVSSNMNEHSGDIGVGRVSGASKFHDGDSNSSGNYFGGSIDDLVIYSVASVTNRAPAANSDSAILGNDESVTLSVLANDSDADGDPLAIMGATVPSNGTVEINEAGTITYTPASDFSGNDSFVYTVSDNQGATSTATVNLQVFATGLVAQYTFDDDTAADVSTHGNDNSGSFVGGLSVVDDPIYGKVLELDGGNDYVAIPNSTDINVGDQRTRTISLSFKADATDTRQVLYEEGGTTRGYNLYLDAGMLYMGTWGMAGAANVYLSAIVNAGQWNHVSLVNDLTLGEITGYLNNTVFGVAASGTLTSHTGNIAIGRYSAATKFHDGNGNGDGAYFKGQIDNVRIYNSVNRDPLAVTDVATVNEDDSVTVSVGLNDGDRDGETLIVESTIDGMFGAAVNNGDGTVTYTPITGYSGPDVFYYRLNDQNGGYSIGSVEVDVIPVASGSVTNRYVFFNDSSFDGGGDVDAIATNKTALMPGETATYENISNYWRGINGLIINVDGFEGVPTVDDFEFRVGNDDTPDDWDIVSAAPTVEFVTDVAGDYVKLTWADNVIQNEWLQVTVLANEITDLAEDDVFYFGNAIGETGNDPANAIVNLADVSLTRQNQSGFSTVGIDSPYDFNRDTLVNLIDVAIARVNQSGFTPVNLITVPGGTGGRGNGAGGKGSGGGGNANGFAINDGDGDSVNGGDGLANRTSADESSGGGLALPPFQAFVVTTPRFGSSADNGELGFENSTVAAIDDSTKWNAAWLATQQDVSWELQDPSLTERLGILDDFAELETDSDSQLEIGMVESYDLEFGEMFAG